MTTHITFARHCEAAHNLRQTERIGGRSNAAEPTPRGLYQAALLGAYFRTEGSSFQAGYSSGAKRTDITLEICEQAAGFEPRNFLRHVDERLLEVSQGKFDGMLRDRVYTPEAIELFRLNELDGHLPTAESLMNAHARTRECVLAIEANYPDASVLVVGHGLAIRAFAGIELGLSKPAILGLQTDNVSLTEINVTGGVITVGEIGKTVIKE